MSLEYLLICVIVAVLSVVQSLFGMGVLVFGTPTLLLLGYDFVTTLGYLLPASFAISLSQVFMAGEHRTPVSRHLYLLCLPGIAVGLWASQIGPLGSWSNILIGVALLVSALVRFWAVPRNFLTMMLKEYSPAYHLFMGVVHGLTNLGGALLAILAGGVSTEKEVIRYTIAHYYLAFSIVQMFVLSVLMGQFQNIISNFPLAIISLSVYGLIGKVVFSKLNNSSFNYAMTIFMFFYGAVVLLK